jgi:hypothetical protein
MLSNAFKLRNMPPFVMMNFLYSMGELMVETYLSHPNLEKLIKSDEKFDICLFENFNTEALFVSYN